MHVPAGRLHRRLELSRYSSRRLMTSALIARPASRRSSQSGTSATTLARLSRIVVVALRRLCRNWPSPSATRAASGNRRHDAPESPRGASSARRRPAGQARRRSASGTSCRRLYRTRRRSTHGLALVDQHRGRRLRVLDRERPAEAAALVRLGQLDELEPAHRAQQPERRVAHLESPVASGRSGGR